MASTVWSRAMLIAGALAAASCASQDTSKVCSANGEIYLCPGDAQCGGVQKLCVKSGGCGNGIVDSGEQCDDGNTLGGDGCSALCQREECGNRVLDPGEVCDDGNTLDKDGCSANCKSKEECGNGIVDRARGEICDDGVDDGKGGVTTPVDGDGCSADCKSTEICGNHIVDKGETCDDGNKTDGDGCSADCLSKEKCDNGVLNPGEECDHDLYDQTQNPTGNNNSNDCREDCVINRCGDGYVDTEVSLHAEQCDGAMPQPFGSRVIAPTEKADCNIDCTSAACGDGKLNKSAGEQCDDHGTLDGDGCSHDCKFEFCGDGIVNNGEACDRAKTPATCNLDCTVSACGDGKLNPQASPAEQCDDHNLIANDGCSATCQFEHCGNGIVDPQEECDGAAGLQPCSATCHQERCGNGILDNDPGRGVVDQCDDGNLTDGDGCSHDCKIEFCGDGILNNGEVCDRTLTPATCNLDCSISSCGDGKLNPSSSPPEQCDDGGHVNGDGCSATCTFEHCGNGVVDNGEECDGAAGLQPCTATCHQERCGNGIIDVDPAHSINEKCDDGNLADGDGCSHDCKIEFCGDGILNNAELCDRALSPATCNLDCSISSCGDGKLNPSSIPPEQCDDHNVGSGDGCSATCTLEHCGNSVLDSGEECDGLVGLQPCTATCHQERCGNGIIDVDLANSINEKCDDGNLSDGDGCSHDCKIEFCGDGILNNAEVCDRALSPATCNLDCTTSACGDGKLNPSAIPAEQCDDHNVANGDGCSATCTFEHCGNGVVDSGEECDGAAGLQPCSATCHQERCGNGIFDVDLAHSINEKCDDGNTTDGDGCAHDCKIEFCGDGILNNNELCDRALSPAICNLDCTLSSCGDGKTNPSAIPAEQCDDGANANGDGCSANCSLEHCGNGVVDAFEECDGLAGLQPCTASCHQERCGNGIIDVDLAHAINEKCDDGNTTDGDGCSHDCKFEFCGDGILNNNEDCDRTLSPDTCNLDCTLSSCGDGVVNAFAVPAEQCDDGANVDGDGCSATCTLEHCGNAILDALEECDGLLGLQPCTATCHQERCGNGILDVDPANSINEQCDDGGTVDDDGCSHDCKFEFCGDGIRNNNEDCDRALTPATCNLDCTLSACGDGKVNAFAVPAEQCDDGANVDGDGCSAVCRLEHCGNGALDALEECDGLLGLQPCSASCHQERCGNGILDIDPANSINEQCDDGNTTNGDRCSSTCQYEP